MSFVIFLVYYTSGSFLQSGAHQLQYKSVFTHPTSSHYPPDTDLWA